MPLMLPIIVTQNSLLFYFVAFYLRIFLCLGENEAQSKKISQEKEEQKGFGHQLASWGDDLMYLLKNKSYMFSTAAFTCLTFCTGALSWFGPNFVMTALKVRKEYQLEGYENDIKEDE